MSASRTDIHSPRNVITEDYEFFGCGNFGRADLDAYSPVNTAPGHALLDQGYRFGENESAGDCYHCGARLTYFAILIHIPTKTFVRVGEQCLDNRFDLATGEFQALRKAGKLNRERRKLSEKKETFVSDPSNARVIDWLKAQVDAGNYGFNGFYDDLLSKFNRYGDLSEKQMAAVEKSRARDEEFAAKRAAEALTASPAPEGKQTIVGEIVTTKWQENGFGGALKCLVKDDRGFKVWTTCPKALGNPDKGTRVQFDVTLTVSNDDKCFAFGNRPSKARLI